MGLSLSYSFLVKDKETAEKIIQETKETAEKLNKMFGDVEIHTVSPTEILVNTPRSESFHLNFSTIEKKREGCKPENYGIPDEMYECTEARNLHHTYYVTRDGKRYYERHRWEPHEYPVKNFTDWERPIFGTKEGLQTKSYTKTHYGGPKAHIMVCDLLEPAKKHAFLQRVRDEAEFCGTAQKNERDYKKLEKNFKDYYLFP